METTKIKIPVAIDDRGVVVTGRSVTNPDNDFSEDLKRQILLDSLNLQIEELSHSPSKIYWVETEIPHSDFETIQSNNVTTEDE